jgi:hypothetical protein
VGETCTQTCGSVGACVNTVVPSTPEEVQAIAASVGYTCTAGTLTGYWSRPHISRCARPAAVAARPRAWPVEGGHCRVGAARP